MMHGALVTRMDDAIAVAEGALEALNNAREDVSEDVDRAMDEAQNRLSEVRGVFSELAAVLADD
jgi:cellobiose-specific phosphotransferase system component IIA